MRVKGVTFSFWPRNHTEFRNALVEEGGYIILTSSCAKVKFNLFIFLSVQFCVHSDKKKMLEELTNDIHQSPNKQKVLMELANCIASGRIC